MKLIAIRFYSFVVTEYGGRMKKYLWLMLVLVVCLSVFGSTFAYTQGGVSLTTEQSGFDVLIKVSPADKAQTITQLKVNGTTYEKVTSKWSAWYDGKYYIDGDTIYTKELNQDDELTLVDATGVEYSFRYDRANEKTFVLIPKEEPAKFITKWVDEEGSNLKDPVTAEETKEAGDIEGYTFVETQTDEDGNVIHVFKKVKAPEEDKLILTPVVGFNNDFKIKVSPAEKAAQIEKLRVESAEYKLVDSKPLSWYEGNYYIEGNTIYMFSLEDQEVITVSVRENGQLNDYSFRYDKSADPKALVLLDEVEPVRELKVRIVGNFEAAMVNQKGYDGISGATSSVTQNKNSNVAIQVTEVEDPQEEDWINLHESSIRATSDSKVIIDDGSGMQGVYSTLDSSLTLNGTPTTAGTYMVQVKLVDSQGRMAMSNSLPFKVYDYNEKLIDHMTVENSKQMQDGKYIWDMEPWVIKKFGGENETVTVPSEIKAVFGSHTSGTYGELGYAVPAEPTQTLIIDAGTDLTLLNMKVLSSVEVIVKDGGKLSLHDSSIHGKITVENGGTFQMNYDSHNKKFLTGASINGQLVVKDGGAIESSMIYSNSNYLGNGDFVRHNVNPVVKVLGNATIIGDVFIKGDEAPGGTDPNTGKSFTGQPALEVVGGTLNIPEGSTLGVYGGGQTALTSHGAPALKLDNAKVEGDGRLIAIAGSGFLGDGGTAVEGTGTLHVKKAYLKGGNASGKGVQPGPAKSDTVTILKSTVGTADQGKVIVTSQDDDQPHYWRDITEVPDTNFDMGKEELGTNASDDGSDNTGDGSDNFGNGNDNSEDTIPGVVVLKNEMYPIEVKGNKGVLSEKWRLVVTKLDESFAGYDTVAYDIKVVDENNKVIENFKQMIEVVIEIPQNLRDGDVVLFYNPQGEKLVEHMSTRKGNSIHFMTDHFSNWVIAKKQVANASPAKKSLPNTGETSQMYFILGSLFLVAAALVLFLRRRQNK